MASDSSNITDKPATDVDLLQTTTISDDDPLQLDPPRSLVSSNNEVADTFEAVNEVNTVDMTSVSSPRPLTFSVPAFFEKLKNCFLLTSCFILFVFRILK